MTAAIARVIPARELRRVPWRNGGGTTIELAAGSFDGSGEWTWRVSLADVAADGPFSAFPGIARQIVVVEGAGMDLVMPDGGAVALDPGRLFRFDGAAAPLGRLRAGPLRAFNVMTRLGRAAARVAVIDGPAWRRLALRQGSALLLHALVGGCRAGGQDLSAGDTLRVEGLAVARLRVLAGGRALVVRIDPAGPQAGPGGRPCVRRA